MYIIQPRVVSNRAGVLQHDHMQLAVLMLAGRFQNAFDAAALMSLMQYAGGGPQ